MNPQIFFPCLMYKEHHLSLYVDDVAAFHEEAFGLTHFLMMGMNSDHVDDGFYGAWDRNDIYGTSLQEGKDAKTAYNLSVVQERLKNFGPVGYVSFLVHKAEWVLTDGTFFWAREGGSFPTDPVQNEPIAKLFQSFVYPEEYGGHENSYQRYAAYLHGLWVLILALIVLSAVKKRSSSNVWIITVRMTLIGLLLFILLFEGRSRYLIMYLPFFVLLASHGVVVVSACFQKRINHRKAAAAKEDR